jgi:hypothetical protein
MLSFLMPHNSFFLQYSGRPCACRINGFLLHVHFSAQIRATTHGRLQVFSCPRQTNVCPRPLLSWFLPIKILSTTNQAVTPYSVLGQVHSLLQILGLCASSYSFQYHLVSLKSPSSCLRLLPPLPITSVLLILRSLQLHLCLVCFSSFPAFFLSKKPDGYNAVPGNVLALLVL